MGDCGRCYGNFREFGGIIWEILKNYLGIFWELFNFFFYLSNDIGKVLRYF
jgi:hypothetical protein